MILENAAPHPMDRGGANLARRTVLASALALAACGRGTGKASADTGAKARPKGPPPLLRDLAPFRIGTEIVSDEFGRPGFDAAASSQFSQITPGFEMKMEYILQQDGSMRFEGGDRIAEFCKANNQALHGHTLIWYIDKPVAFQKLVGDKKAFDRAYANYIQTVAGRYKGQARAWDVVNEPVADDGVTLRESFWTENLGQEGHFIRAHEEAHAADPEALLFVNEYHLESKPHKRRTFLKLVEDMLKRGVKIDGIGNQTHIDVDLPPGKITEAMRDLASLGLPIHLSEIDVSFQTEGVTLRSPAERQASQLRLYREALESFIALPEKQQYAFTIWGVRDADSWLRTAAWVKEKTDKPLLFDDMGQPKETFWTLVDVLQGR
jgi:endo-1,4-beta-xylanase